MFFENEMVATNITDVLYLKQEKINIFNSGRSFNAISFRIKANTVIKTNTEKFELSDNHITFIPAGCDYTRISKNDELIAVHIDTPTFHSNEIETLKTNEPQKMAELFKRLLKIWEQKNLGYKYEAQAVLCEILALCYKQNYKGETENSKIKKSIDFLYSNYKNKDICIKEIADKSYISEVYFRKLFKEEFGCSPQKFIIKLRIQNAAELIKTGYYSLKEIAYISGYNDYKHFTVEFKRIMGVSPSNYLKSIKK